MTVTVGDRTLAATWTDENPRTRDAVEHALLLSGRATRWGDEFYVRCGVDVPPENTRDRVGPGALAYWPRGNAVCLFWGPAPASDGDEPRAASPVNVFARVGDVTPLSSVDGDARVRL